MALKHSVVTLSGLLAKDAIHKIECVTIHGKARVAFLVRSYAAPLPIEPQSPVDVEESQPLDPHNVPLDPPEVPYYDDQAFEERAYECDYDVAGANPFTQGYAHLKTLPMFEGAIDV